MAQLAIGQMLRAAADHYQNGRLQQAEEIYRQVLSQQPTNVTAMHLLGVISSQMGRHITAIGFLQRALVIDPGSAGAWVDLGSALNDKGDINDALVAFERALALTPDSAAALCNLGVVHRRKGNLDDAIEAFGRLTVAFPALPQGYNNLGIALKEKGRVNEAVAALERAIALNPTYADAHNNLGTALKDAKKPGEAIASFQAAIALKADYSEAHANLGNAYRDIGRLDDALAATGRANTLAPRNAEIYNNLGGIFSDMGQMDDAIAAYRQAIALMPAATRLRSNLLYAIHYHPDFDARAIADEHRHWQREITEPLKRSILAFMNDRDPSRRLRVGYLSPDFREHPVGRFILPLLTHHEKRDFEIFAYAQVLSPDEMTGWLRGHVDNWRSIVGLSDAQAVEMIRKDQIDILVDLALHSAGNRALVFAAKPAPVQVSYLAYCSTTGLDTIDYRLSDPYLDPPGEDESVFSEKTLRLPESYWCYQPVARTAEVKSLPAVANGFVTFGCLNNFCKVNDAVLAVWTEILRALPNARLLLHAHEGSHRNRVARFFQQRQIETSRLEFVGFARAEKYLDLYGKIDIALDTFPYAGGTTTCDALWMGVPVISLAGRTAVGRAGVSILSNIGAREFIAASTSEYVRLAIELAGDTQRLLALRSSLRARMKKSPLMDAERFTRNVEAAYRQMWRAWCAKPTADDSAALRQRGILAYQSGDFAVAVECFQKAVEMTPAAAELHNDLGIALRGAGKLDLAAEACRRAISMKSDYAIAYSNLGVVLKEAGKIDEAINAFTHAARLNPSDARAHGNLGAALREKERFDEACAAFRRAAALNPNSPEIQNILGNVLKSAGHYDDAIVACRRAIALKPDYADAYCNLGNTLTTIERFDEAIAAYQKAILLEPAQATFSFNLGNTLRDNGQLEEAGVAFGQAIALKPDYPEASSNLGNTLRGLGRVDEAIAMMRRAVAQKPDNAETRNNLAMALLLRGDFSEGWVEHEWRWKCEDFPSLQRTFPQPLWSGQPLNGATLLLHGEQGFGDVIQFIRYLPMALQRGGTIILECQPALARLIKSIASDCQVVAQGDPLPLFDFHCPLLSLPLAFKTTIDTIPASVPYLRAEPALVADWKARLGCDANLRQVGLVWAGNKSHKNDRNRSIDISTLLPIMQTTGVRFHSLQKGEASAAINRLPPGVRPLDWEEALDDFADTAALIANLDLVISVDTSVAHLAGAMGKPIWILLPFAPDWRWLMNRTDSPWYPTMRLFRQTVRRDWTSVIDQVGQALISSPATW